MQHPLRQSLAIPTFLSSRRPPHPLNFDRDDQNMANTSKIRQNMCVEGQNAVKSCQKMHNTLSSRGPIIFVTFASDSLSNSDLRKCINSVLEILRFLDALTQFRRFEKHIFWVENSGKNIFWL